MLNYLLLNISKSCLIQALSSFGGIMKNNYVNFLILDSQTIDLPLVFLDFTRIS